VLALTGFLSWQKALTCSNWGLLVLVGGDPIRQLVLYERNFGCMDVWELNPERLGSLWLMVSATWGGGGSFWLKSSMIGEGRLCPF
jgi:hypothetical protein